MAAYELYYWPIPFRGQFARCVLAHQGVAYEMPPVSQLMKLKTTPPADCPALFMAPPLLHDVADDLWVSQNAAIVTHLARKLGLQPKDGDRQTLALKTILDCNDVLNEITCQCGEKMWAVEEWTKWRDHRLVKWLQIFEETGRRHGLTADSGFFLGTAEATVADTSLVALWTTMEAALPELGYVLRKNAPTVMALCDRVVAASEGLKTLLAGQPQTPYCGGQIEQSLREMLAQPQ